MSSKRKSDNWDHSLSRARNDRSIFGKVSFYGLLILIGATAIPYGTVDPWLNHLVVVFVCICGLLRILDGIIVKDHSFGGMWMLSPLIVLLLFAIIQSLPVWSLNSIADLPYLSGQSLSLSPVETRNFVLRFAGYLITAEILFYYVTSQKRLQMVLLTFLIISLGSLVFAFIRNFLISGDLPRLPAGVGFGQFINQNHFAFLMEMLLGVLAGLLIKADISRGLKLLSGVSLGLAVIALILSNSRGAVLSLVGSGIVAIGLVVVLPAFLGNSSPRARRVPASSGIFLRKTVLAAVLIILFITLAAFTVAFVGGDRMVSRIETIPGETTSSPMGRRIDFWQATGNLIAEYPVLGAGFGAYTSAITKYEKSSGRFILQQAHNDYLDLVANGGVVSVLLAVSFFILLGKAFLQRLKYSDGFRAALCVGAAIGISGVLLHSLVEFGLRTNVNAFAFILLIIMAAAATDESSRNSRRRPAAETRSLEAEKTPQNVKRRPVIMLLVYLLIVIFIGALNLKVALSFYFLDIAALTRSEPPAVRAVSFDPSNYQAYDTSGQILLRSGQYAGSVDSFKRAVALDPNNYSLRLNLATALLGADQVDEAIESCRAAIKLAPSYAGPQLAMGLIYFKEQKFDEAFAYINKAADIDLDLLPLLLRTAQSSFSEDALIDRMVAPSTRAGQIFAANYFLDNNIRSEKMEAFLTRGDLPDEEKEKFVRKLIAFKRFPLAFKVWNSQTGNEMGRSSPDAPHLLNGGFENELTLNESGFGWQTQRKRSGDITITQTEGTSFAGQRSLKLEFNGDPDPAVHVISQTVVVEPRGNYQLTFAFNSSELVTGGQPLITVLDGNSGNTLSQSSVIGPTGGKWQVRTLDLQTGQMTQAVVISLQRKGCSAPACPIFGSIFLDEFILERIGNKK